MFVDPSRFYPSLPDASLRPQTLPTLPAKLVGARRAFNLSRAQLIALIHTHPGKSEWHKLQTGMTLFQIQCKSIVCACTSLHTVSRGHDWFVSERFV